ncbi:unnamed protein product [Rotaria socialis]|uniref:Gag-like protein n=1 Tax=Rotaria socialis TaxID=392032 RepID=A0A818WZE9_9BILA|nr:unnamed protein product [Rotaria socialis]CAF4880668.1 unnamed protein product [Rotaria socialis]
MANELDNSQATPQGITHSLEPATFEDFPRFVILKANSGQKPLTTCLFEVHSDFKNTLRTPKQMWGENDGTLVVEVTSRQQYEKVCSLSSLGGSSHNHQEHPTLNVTKGVVASHNLCIQHSELAAKLAEKKVTNVYNITRSLNGVHVPTNTFITTFNTSHLQELIICGYERFPVRPFVSRPRCFNSCNFFGHNQKNCKRPSVCVNCGQSPSHGACSLPENCSNCGEQHAASSQSCVTYLFEKDVLARNDS